MHPSKLAHSFVIVFLCCCFDAQQLEVNIRQEGGNMVSEEEECVFKKFDAHFEGKSSPFVTECRDFINASQLQLEPDLSNAYFQAESNVFFSTFCAPECGDKCI